MKFADEKPKKVKLKVDFQGHKKGEWLECSPAVAKTLIAQGKAVDFSKTNKSK